ncbi:MAG: hypothetical protein MPK62_06100 [Alphaproteobacteria bacterium]|nr:hypothetical protein [Alphaproteobacteria bacterium]
MIRRGGSGINRTGTGGTGRIAQFGSTVDDWRDSAWTAGEARISAVCGGGDGGCDGGGDGGGDGDGAVSGASGTERHGTRTSL